MTLTPHLTVNIELRDAIAYDFFLSKIESVLEESEMAGDGKEVENMFLLAECALHVGDIFVLAREKHKNLVIQEETTEEAE